MKAACNKCGSLVHMEIKSGVAIPDEAFVDPCEKCIEEPLDNILRHIKDVSGSSKNED